MAHYLMRWRMRDGTTGPWGETAKRDDHRLIKRPRRY
jgi:hypothetical protein